MGKMKQEWQDKKDKLYEDFAEGNLSTQECAEELQRLGVDSDEIEQSLDLLMGDHTKAVADKAIEKAKNKKYSWWTTPKSDWTTRKKQ